MAALIPLAGAIASTAWGSSGLEGLVRLTLILVPVSAVQAALTQVQRIEGSPRRFAFLALFDLMAQLALAVALVGLGLGPAGVVIGFIVGSLGGLLLAALAARDVLRVKPDLEQAKGIIGRGLQFLPYVAAFVLADWSLRSIVASSFGTGEVAAMGIATRIASLLTLLSSAFALAWGPVGLARSPSPATARLFAFVLSAYGVVSVAGALILAAIGPELIRLLAGPGYEMASLILPGFAFAYAIAGAEYVLVVAAGVSERGSRVAVSSSLGAAVQVVLGAFSHPDHRDRYARTNCGCRATYQFRDVAGGSAFVGGNPHRQVVGNRCIGSTRIHADQPGA